MASPHALFEWLSHTAISQTFNEAHYLFFGGFMAAHLAGIALLGGTALLTDLRVLGIGVRSATPAQVVGELRPWLWSGLAIVVLSGGWLLIADPLKYYVNPAFRAKAALLLTALVLQHLVHRLARAQATPRVGAKVVAAVTALLWISTAAAGRVVGLL
ncbi:DUF6644 family protein [Pseudoxanthomonas sp.]|uniref:DUF6644 family protein n=1 Tax=Pseudoxanthomonas sp. TaxID=1871049 RepID=UPI0026081DD5|nr:DUF6644 family protein [Pseudoxanthomonas sp.]WDS37012.1 MAG: hypothetical protein O8I58_03645 [Pseudoxanthomonas sp.]